MKIEATASPRTAGRAPHLLLAAIGSFIALFAPACTCTGAPVSDIDGGVALVDGGDAVDSGVVVDAGDVRPDAGFADGAACASCVSAADCAANASCVQIGGDDVCATHCANDGECGAGETCADAVDASGARTRVCAPTSGSCGGGGCGTCDPGSTCDVSSGTCVTPPAGVGDGGGGPLNPVGGTVDENGGTVTGLYFGVVGDTRPGSFDDTAGYPSEIVNRIYADLQGLATKPQFIVGTGDYMYAQKDGPQGALQIAKYTSAAAQFTNGPLFAAMGNHECASITSVNCAGLLGSPTANMNAYLDALVTPLHKDKPYYTIHFTSTDASWTAKVIVTACNAWDHDQRVFFDGALSEDTTYTIVVRHEPQTTLFAPCIAEEDVILALHPYDLLVVGHTHTFKHGGRQIIVGNGGAPVSSASTPYGFATVELLPGQGFRVVQYDSELDLPIDAFIVGP